MGEAERKDVWTPPRTFDSFEVERPLGVGGMGHVYLGRDAMLDRNVALKFIASSSPTPEARERFLIEARAIAKLHHPNVVGVFRIGEVDDRPYIAYELVNGYSLDVTARPMTWSSVLQIATLLARGLEAAHRVGIVHRDIKPSNVMVSSSGEVKLLDFGIAKLDAREGTPSTRLTLRPTTVVAAPFAVTEADPSAATPRAEPPAAGRSDGSALTRPGSLIGTPAYLAPELWLGEVATPRSDVFAVGLVLYELLAGVLPFAPLAGAALAVAVTEKDIAPIRHRRPEIPHAFAAIVDTCLQRHPQGRYESAAALRAALEDVKSVYLPRDEVDGLRLEGSARVVADSFARMLPRAGELASGVYNRLFEAAPNVRPLFPEDLTEQKSKLLHALRLAVEGLHQPNRLADMLRELGRRHGGYGVTPSHFEALKVAFSATMNELDASAWNDEVARAWSDAYDFVAATMIQGLSNAGTTAVSDVAGVSPFGPRASSTPGSARSATPASGRAGRQATPASQIPRTQYARNADVSLAYHVLGDGLAKPDLVVVLGWVTHLELAYSHPSLESFLLALARTYRVILFDKRGTGLSDRVLQGATFEDRASDIGAVMDAAGSSSALLFGVSEGGALAAFFAAEHPERVRGLAVWASTPRMTQAPGYAAGLDPAEVDRVCATVLEEWGTETFARRDAPSMNEDQIFADWFGQTMRMGASPGNAAAMMRANAEPDLRRILPMLAVPTLVMHRRGDRVIPVAGGEAFADLVPRARWVLLDGEDHTPFTGDTAPVLLALQQFHTELSGAPPADAVPLVALVAFREAPSIMLLVETAVRLGGRYLGDDVFAFESLSRALSFAARAVAEDASRAGVHFGRCPTGSVSGTLPTLRTAVSLAAFARPGEVLATEIVRDLGMGVLFELEPAGKSADSELGPLAILEVRSRWGPVRRA